MMNVIIAEDLVDLDYVENYTLGYDELKARAAQYPPEKVAEITGVSADDVRKLAREYATTQPSAIREGVALERSRGGGDANPWLSPVCRPSSAPGAMSGRRRRDADLGFPVQVRQNLPSGLDQTGYAGRQRARPRAALTGELKLDPPIMSLFVYNSNPVSQAPAQNKVVQGLKREDLFTVVSELFITDTARYADLLLRQPCRLSNMTSR